MVAIDPLEEILDGETVVAVVIRANYREPGVHFFSRPQHSQQLGSIVYPRGHIIAPHVHNPVPREVMYTQETLFIRDARVRCDLFRDDRTFITSRELGPGDVIMLCSGGHGFEILEEGSIIEVKQGPYAGGADKTRFEAADA